MKIPIKKKSAIVLLEKSEGSLLPETCNRSIAKILETAFKKFKINTSAKIRKIFLAKSWSYSR